MKGVLYRLDKYECENCGTGFLVDRRWITTKHADLSPKLLCPSCGHQCECSASTADELSHDFEAVWGCAYPNPLRWDEEREWHRQHDSQD